MPRRLAREVTASIRSAMGMAAPFSRPLAAAAGVLPWYRARSGRDGGLRRPGGPVEDVEGLGRQTLDPDRGLQLVEVRVGGPDVGTLLVGHPVGPGDRGAFGPRHDDILPSKER